MQISMFQISVPVFMRMLGSLETILGKAEAHCQERNIDPAALLQARLFPDMFNLTRQVQVAADAAKNGIGYLAGVEPPKFENTEQSFDELIARVRKSMDYVSRFSPEQINGSETREVVIQRGETTVRYSGQDYLLTRTLPNFYFHITTAYDILRHNGVALGKRDYLGR